MMEGTEVGQCKDGPELFVRCKIAAKGSSDWHGLILGGRALDCEARRGLGFRPGPHAHILDTLGIQVPRCEDLQCERKDRAYAFESVLASTDHGLHGASEPGRGQRALLSFSGDEPAQLAPGEGALVPVLRTGTWLPDATRCEAVLPVDGSVEAVAGIWPTGSREGFMLVTPRQREVVLEKGDVVAEVRRGSIATGTCSCGAVDTVLTDLEKGFACSACSVQQVDFSVHQCSSCGCTGRISALPLQGCRGCGSGKGEKAEQKRRKARGYGLLATFVGLSALAASACNFVVHREESGQRDWASFPGGIARAHGEAHEELYVPTAVDFPGDLEQLSNRRTTCARLAHGGEKVVDDDWRVKGARSPFGQEWTGETRFYWASEPNATCWGSSGCVSTITNPVLHIVETPGGIERMADETPTDYYFTI